MKIVEINTGCHGSTGRMMLSIARNLEKRGHTVYTFSAYEKKSSKIDNHTCIGNQYDRLFNRVRSVFTGISESGSERATREFIKRLDDISPDIVHLHNLHGWYLNIEMLFGYLKKNNVKAIWTLHDCWGFTAQCSHFTMEKCNKWKTGCYSCPRYHLYPYTWIDRTPQMWKNKKKWLTGIDTLTIITPSEWLANLVRSSFLMEYPVKVINNGIDLTIFKPTPSDFRQRYNLENKKIIVGVASGWNYRKGLDAFIDLSKRLSDDFKIVLVGTDKSVDRSIPDKIISIHRTNNQRELAEIYTAADVFVNPTLEENYPTVNMEAIACGTPVVTYNTGGCAEIVGEGCGIVVRENNVDELEQSIFELTENSDKPIARCVEYAKRFDQNICFKEYVKIICGEEE